MKIGSTFDSWLIEEGIYDTVTADAELKVKLWLERCKMHPCAIERFFRENPDVTSISMTCSCPKCEIICY